MSKFREKLLKEVEAAVYEDGAGNDVLISARVDAILELIEKELPKERILNKDNPQYVLGWNACLGIIKSKLKGD